MSKNYTRQPDQQPRSQEKRVKHRVECNTAIHRSRVAFCTVLMKSGDSNEQNAHTQMSYAFPDSFRTHTQMLTELISQSTYSTLPCTKWVADTRLREYGQSIIWPKFNGTSVLHMNWQTAVEAFLMTSTKTTAA